MGDFVDAKTLDNKVVIIGLKPSTVPKQIILITLGLIVIGSLIFIALNQQIKNVIYLLKTGKKAKATLTVKRDKTQKPSGMAYSANPKVFEIKYTYEDSKGNQIFGGGMANGSTRMKKLRNGDPITILIDPNDESNSTLFPVDLARRYNWK